MDEGSTPVQLTAGAARLVVHPARGGRVASLRVPSPRSDAEGGRLELVGRYSESVHGWGAFPMAPWAGRVRGAVLRWEGTDHPLPVTKPPHAIHGLVQDRPWHVEGREGGGEGVDLGSGVLRLRRDLGPAWPWPGRATLRYDLAEHELRTTLAVHADTVPMPAWVGVHPWFPRRLGGADVHLDVRADALLVRDADGIATAQERPVPDVNAVGVDDCLVGVRWPVVLTWPGVQRLEVDADTAVAVVFTEREQAVCVEPQTAPPDAAALGRAQVATPGSPVVMTMTWRWSPA